MSTIWRLRRYRADDVDRVVEWAAANGLYARDIPISSPIITTADTLTVKLYLIYSQPEPPDVILHRGRNYHIVKRTVPLVELPPEDLFIPTQLNPNDVIDWGS